MIQKFKNPLGLLDSGYCYQNKVLSILSLKNYNMYASSRFVLLHKTFLPILNLLNPVQNKPFL